MGLFFVLVSVAVLHLWEGKTREGFGPANLPGGLLFACLGSAGVAFGDGSVFACVFCFVFVFVCDCRVCFCFVLCLRVPVLFVLFCVCFVYVFIFFFV